METIGIFVDPEDFRGDDQAVIDHVKARIDAEDWSVVEVITSQEVHEETYDFSHASIADNDDN